MGKSPLALTLLIRPSAGKSIRTTITSASTKSGTFWFIIRGIEAYPVVLGDLQLPPTARLKLHRVNRTVELLELVTLVWLPGDAKQSRHWGRSSPLAPFPPHPPPPPLHTQTQTVTTH